MCCALRAVLGLDMAPAVMISTQGMILFENELLLGRFPWFGWILCLTLGKHAPPPLYQPCPDGPQSLGSRLGALHSIWTPSEWQSDIKVSILVFINHLPNHLLAKIYCNPYPHLFWYAVFSTLLASFLFEKSSPKYWCKRSCLVTFEYFTFYIINWIILSMVWLWIP